MTLRQSGNAQYASTPGGDVGTALLEQLFESLTHGSIAGHVQVDHAFRRVLEELPVDGAKGGVLHRRLHARVHVHPVGRGAQSLDPCLAQTPLHPFGCGFSVCRTFANKGEERFVRGLVGHAGDSRPTGSRLPAHHRPRVFRIEGVEYAYGDAGVHGRLHAGSVEHLGPCGRHVERGPVRHLRYGVRHRHVFRVGRHDAGHVRPDLEVIRLQGRGEDAGGKVAAPSAQSRALAFVGAGDEAGRHEHLHVWIKGDGSGYIAIG